MRVSCSKADRQNLLDPRRLVAIAAAADDLPSFADELLDRCERAVGFDVAYHAAAGEPPMLSAVRGFGDLELRRIHENGAEYMRELMPVKRAAFAQSGVAIDSQVFSSRQRERLAYFVEMMAPDGGRHALVALGIVGRTVVSATMLGRTGSCFSPADVRAMQAIVPVLGLATSAHLRGAITPVDGARGVRRSGRAAVDLSPRERDLVDYVALGLTNAQIGSVLGTSPRTVRNQLSALYTRLGASNRAELVSLLRSSAGP